MDPEALKNMSPAQQQEIISAVQQQVALANMQARRISRREKLFLNFDLQELLQKVTDKCFKRCITSPGSSMSSSDTKCVSLCMDRSVPSWCPGIAENDLDATFNSAYSIDNPESKSEVQSP